MSKKLSLIFLTLLVFLRLGAQDQFVNYPLPQNPDTLRILAVGNSFSDDGTEYLPALLEGAGIHNVIVGRLYIGGCSLERHCKEYAEGTKNYVYYKSTENRWTTVSKNAGILDGIKDEPWDIITIQEVSNHSGTYDTYQAWAPKLISIIRKEALNPQASIVWHMTWAYASNSNHVAFPLYDRDQDKMYAMIMAASAKACKEHGLAVIPCGTAMQDLRGTFVGDNVTRDGFHLNNLGCYTAACTWYQTLFGECVVGNAFRPQYLTEEEVETAQKAAAAAVRKPFKVSKVK